MEGKKSIGSRIMSGVKYGTAVLAGALIGAKFHETVNSTRENVVKGCKGLLSGNKKQQPEETIEVENRPQQQYQPRYNGNNGGYNNNNRFNNNNK